MNSFLETLKQLGPARLAVLGGVLVSLLIFFVFVSMRISTPEYKLLYTDLAAQDSGAMASKLDEEQIPFEIAADGSSISVPENEVSRARMLLAQEGLPSGGSMGYEIFDQQSGFGTTNFVQNINKVRALEGELARTISHVESVSNARVHLVLPQRELFSRESRPASASVFLTMRGNSSLSSEQIASIQSLVASAVPELKANTVSIVDSNGNLLARADGDENSLIASKAVEMRRNYEQRLTRSIEDMVGRIVGFGNVRANVTADLNYDRISTNEEVYDPESAVVRSSQLIEESNTEREPVGDDVSVDQNLPGVAGDLFVDRAPTNEGNRVEETTNYEISRTVRSTVSEVGEVSKISVAVLVNGTYTTNEEGERVYEERSQEELDNIASLVRSAVGYDESRGDSIEVVNMRFADIAAENVSPIEDLLFGFERSDLLDAVEIITVAIMIILVILLVVQPMIGRLLASESESEEESLKQDLLSGRGVSPALEGPAGEDFQPPALDDEEDEDGMIDMSRVEGKVKASSVKKVEDIVDNYPEETVSVIRSWMGSEN